MKTKKICVTGGAGMIGSTLVKRLVQLGNSVTVIDNLWRGKLSNLAGVEGLDLASNFHEIDLADGSKADQLYQIIADHDVVIHLADIVAGIGYVFNNQYDIYRINNLINTNVFYACAKANIPKVLYAGTACSFPKTMQMSLDSILREDDLFPAHPESAYGWSKLNGTLELEFLSEKYGVETVTLMLHNVYGPYCDIDPKRSQVIPSIIRKIIELPDGGKLDVWGSGNQGRAFLHVDDVVSGLTKCVYAVDPLPKVVQLGPNVCTSIKELVYILKDQVAKKEIDIVFDSSKPEGDIGRSADSSLALQHLGWAPEVDLVDGLRGTFEWIKAELDGK